MKADNTKHQSILLKCGSFRACDAMYQARKRLPFSVNHDLTKRLKEILNFTRELVSDDESVSKIISYVFVDKNCKFKFKSTTNKYYGFSTTEEFMTLVKKIGSEHSYWMNRVVSCTTNILFLCLLYGLQSFFDILLTSTIFAFTLNFSCYGTFFYHYSNLCQ